MTRQSVIALMILAAILLALLWELPPLRMPY